MKILVLGDLMIDYFMDGKTSRISPEAPVPIVDISKEFKHLGGAGNVCRNLSDLGFDVVLYTAFDKTDYDEIISLTEGYNITIQGINIPKTTHKKIRVRSNGQQVCRIDYGDKINWPKQSIKSYMHFLKENKNQFDCIVISDYNKGVVSSEISKYTINFFKEVNIPVIVDPKGLDFSKYKGAYAITPNKSEFVMSKQGNEVVNSETIFSMLTKLSLKNILVTLSEDGIFTMNFKKQFYHDKLDPLEVIDVTGAGDTVISIFCYLICNEYSDIKIISKICNAAGRVVVQKYGCSTIKEHDLKKILETYD